MVVGPVRGIDVVIVVPEEGPTETLEEADATELLEAEAAELLALTDVLEPPSVIVVGPVSGIDVVIVVPADGPAETLEEAVTDELEPPSVIVVGPVSGIDVVMVVPADGPTETVEFADSAELLEETVTTELLALADELDPPRVIVVGPVSGIEVVIVVPADALTELVIAPPDETEGVVALTLLLVLTIDEEPVPPRVIVVGPVRGIVVERVVPAEGPTDDAEELLGDTETVEALELATVPDAAVVALRLALANPELCADETRMLDEAEPADVGTEVDAGPTDVALEDETRLLLLPEPEPGTTTVDVVALPLLAGMLELIADETEAETEALDTDGIRLVDSGPTGTALDTRVDEMVALALTVATPELAEIGAECVWVSTTVLAMVVPFSTDDTVDVQSVVYVVKLDSALDTGAEVVALALTEKPVDAALLEAAVVEAPVLIGPTLTGDVTFKPVEAPLLKADVADEPVGPTAADDVPLKLVTPVDTELEDAPVPVGPATTDVVLLYRLVDPVIGAEWVCVAR